MFDKDAQQQTTPAKNRLFLQYGHDCDCARDLDKVAKYVPGNDVGSAFKRFYLRHILISETNVLVDQYYRSQGSIANEKLRQLRRNHIFIVHPFSDVRRWWELIMIFVFIGEFLIIPLDLAYHSTPNHTHNELWDFISVLFNCLCAVDIGMSFLSGYFDRRRKKVILNPHLIAITYAKSFLIVDAIATMSRFLGGLGYFHREGNVMSTVLHVACLIRFIRFITFRQYATRTAKKYDVSFIVHNGLMIFISGCFYVHLICCCMICVQALTMTQDEDDMFDQGSLHVYLRMFYSSCIIINNAGIGLDRPYNNLGPYVILSLLVLSRLIRILFIVRLAELIKARTATYLKYIEMVRQLREYMRHKQLPEYVQKRLINYYEFRFQKSYFRENEILATISGQLRQDIVMGTCRKLVENVSFFKNLPLSLLVRIVSSLQLEIFLINDVIVRARTMGDCMYFIGSGTVALYTTFGQEVCHLEDGGYFGEICLIFQQSTRILTIVALETCELYRLNKNEFLRAISPYPDLMENMQKVATERREAVRMLNEIHKREKEMKKKSMEREKLKKTSR